MSSGGATSKSRNIDTTVATRSVPHRGRITLQEDQVHMEEALPFSIDVKEGEK